MAHGDDSYAFFECNVIQTLLCRRLTEQFIVPERIRGRISDSGAKLPETK
jgi:hypothetical protein